MANSKWLARLLPLAFLAFVGCGQDGPKVVKVSGTLTFKGKPVPNAELTFEPEKGRQSWAETDAQGKFKINYDDRQDGAVVGKHNFFARPKPTKPTKAEEDAVMAGKVLEHSKEAKEFFTKYGEGTKHPIEIKGATSDLKIDLN